MSWEELDEKQQKKFNKALRNAIICLGIGAGMMLVKPMFTGTEDAGTSERTVALFTTTGLSLIVYGTVIIACGIFLKNITAKINLIAFYLVLPAIIIKAIADWHS